METTANPTTRGTLIYFSQLEAKIRSQYPAAMLAVRVNISVNPDSKSIAHSITFGDRDLDWDWDQADHNLNVGLKGIVEVFQTAEAKEKGTGWLAVHKKALALMAKIVAYEKGKISSKAVETWRRKLEAEVPVL